MALNKQMEMFEDGGLKDEGGTVDPVSGNDVPPGSTQEEVRDDIPAQLSEGEFVFPADVVRYIGLGNLMRMRQEAKMGLKMMDEMGQMGNSDEATMPDDLPFDINDLDMEDEVEDNKELEMQVGGFVQPTQQQQQMGISGYQQAAAPTTGVATVPQQAASQQYVQPVQPVQAAVPTMQAYKPSEVPTFQQTIGDDAFGTYDELRQYKNEAGNILNVPFRNGQPISPIPEGYTYVDPEATKTEEVTTTPTTPQTTSVREDGGDADRAKLEEEKYGPGGGRLGIPGTDTIYGVSFDNMSTLPGALGAVQGAVGLATGKPLPSDAVVNFKLDDDVFTLTGDEYNRVKTAFNNDTLSRKEKQDIFEAARYEGKVRQAEKAIEEAKKAEKRVKTSDVFKDSGFQETGGDESVDTSSKGAALEASLRGSPTPGGTGRGRQDYSGGYSQDDTAGNETSQTTPDQDSGSSTGGYYDFNQGGLAAKSKPKKTKKKMKRGGLASKK